MGTGLTEDVDLLHRKHSITVSEAASCERAAPNGWATPCGRARAAEGRYGGRSRRGAFVEIFGFHQFERGLQMEISSQDTATPQRSSNTRTHYEVRSSSAGRPGS